MHSRRTDGTRGGSGTIERLMFSDDDPDIRQHAAFALAQSTSPNRTDALIRQGRQDTDGETRAEAWFWLAQSDSDRALAVVERLLFEGPRNTP